MWNLSDKTIKTLEESISLSIDEIRNLTFEEEMAYVKMKTGKPIKFDKNARIDGMRIKTMEDVDKYLDKIFIRDALSPRLRISNTIELIKYKLVRGLSSSKLSVADKVTNEIINENKHKVLTLRKRHK